MTSATVEEAARNFPSLLAAIRSGQHELFITDEGETVATLSPVPSTRSKEELLRSLQETQEWWMSVTSQEERDSFAHDIEVAHVSMNQTVSSRFSDVPR